MEPNPNQNYASTNRDNSQRLNNADINNKSQQGLSFVGQSNRSYGLDMVSPTYQTSRKEFTSTLRQGNKSSSKIRMKSANSLSINSGNMHNENENKFRSNLKQSHSKDKSKLMNNYGDNSNKYFLCLNILFILLSKTT